MKYLNIGLIALFLISSSNIAHSATKVPFGNMDLSEIDGKECRAVLKDGKILRSEDLSDGSGDRGGALTILYGNNLYLIYIDSFLKDPGEYSCEWLKRSF